MEMQLLLPARGTVSRASMVDTYAPETVNHSLIELKPLGLFSCWTWLSTFLIFLWFLPKEKVFLFENSTLSKLL